MNDTLPSTRGERWLHALAGETATNAPVRYADALPGKDH